jgi:hypothetical protein
VVPPANIKDQYLTNVLLKINAKVCVMICVAILNVPYNSDLLADKLNSSLFLFVFPISLAGWIHCWKMKQHVPFLLCRKLKQSSLVWMSRMVHRDLTYHRLLQ